MTRAIVSLVTATLLVSSMSARPALAQQTWYAAYEEGVDAIKQKDWATAETKLKDALKSNSKQGRNVLFYGTRRQPYLPEFYLAQVYLNTGRPKEAADLLAKVEREGLIKQNDREYAELTRMSGSAQAALAKATPGGTQTESGRVAGGTGGTTAGGNMLGNTQGGSQGNQSGGQQTGATHTGGTQPAGGGTPGGTQTAGNTVTPPANRTGEDADRQRRDQAARQLAQQIGDTTTAIEAAIGQRNWPEAQRQLGQLRTLDPNHAKFTQYRTTIDAGLEARAVADAERTALRAFYSGDYTRALSLFDTPQLRKTSTPRRVLYIACSNVALGLLEGPPGADRIARARQQFAQVRGATASLRADRRFISPKILEVLEAPTPR